MATEALRRLREEIDAAFEAQRRPRNETRRAKTAAQNLAPKWAQVTALLASVGRPADKKATFQTATSDAASLKPLPCVFRTKQQDMMSEKEKQKLLRGFLVEWRRVTRAAGVVTRLHVRATRRRNERLVAAVVSAWRCRKTYQRWLTVVASSVRERNGFTRTEVAWRRWRQLHSREAKWREFYSRRRWRLSCEAFCAWVLATNQRLRYRSYKEKAQRQLLRRNWRWFMAAIETQRMINVAVEHFTQKRLANFVERFFLLWGEFVEQSKLWGFAVRWSERRKLGDAYDGWRDVHEHTRRLRHTLQLAIRRRRRHILREVVKVWRSQTIKAVTQKRTLVRVLHSQQRRHAFTHLVLSMRYELEREQALQCWKTRRVVLTWLHRSRQCRMIRLRAQFLKENHERLILRDVVWRPWRRAYKRSSALRRFTLKQRARQLSKCWVAFVDVVNEREHRRLMVGGMADKREVRALRHSITMWRFEVNAARKLKEMTAKSNDFFSQKMLRSCLARWKEARQVMLRQNYLNKIAIAHLASKLVQHWAKWAYWSRRELGKRIVAVVEQRRQRKLLQCVGHWKELVHARRKRLWSKYFSLWKMAIQVQHRDHHLLALRYLIHFRWRWQCWRLLVQDSKHIQAIAEAAKKLREQRLLRHSFVSVWLRKVCRYKLGSKILGAFAKRQVLIWAIKRWRKKQLQLSAQALANAFRRKKLQSYYLHLLFLETVGHYRIAVAYERRHRLVCTWASWNQYFKLKRRRYEAEAYFRHRSKLKAVQILHVATINAARRRNQHLDAKAWFEAVLLQSVFSHWFEAAKHVRWCRSLGKYLAWHTVGQRAFGEWQNACMERQNLRLAEQFYSSTLLTQSWNALLRVTKRRQVALAMWNHAMIRVRLTHAVSGWKDFVAERRGQFAVATTMNRMQQLRMRQQLFNAWALVATARRLALRREQRESLKWNQTCWTHWKLWRVSCRWHRSQHLLLLRNTFALGLKRHAIQQQACREVYMRTARHLLHRSLFRWRVEWWLICNHKRLCAEIKSKALSHWKAFVAACRQKRRWEHYVQQLHRVQTRSSAVAPYAKYRVGGTFRDTRALQAQLKRNRVLMTHVLHAWYLVVQNRRRRTQLAMSKKSRRRQDPQSNSKARQIALEFWARRVIQRCFFIWREQSAGSRRAEVQCKVAFRWSKVSNG